MTERIYYKDPTILEFEATIVETGNYGDHYFAILDKSAFYPTSGGQLYDTGKLNNITVIEVIEKDDLVLHLTDQKVGNVGDIIEGKVDRLRRQINRQNHTAQHLLSQAFVKLYNFETVSVHLGEEYGAIELNTSSINTEQLKEAEKLANEIIVSNLPIEILFIDSENLKDYSLRKVPNRKGSIRIIKTGDFDISACGGTHCTTTAEVGLIKITDTEKMRKHILVKFLAGTLAVADYSLRYDITHRLSALMTCHFNDLIDKYEKLIAENKNCRKQIAQLNRDLLPVIADRIISKKENINNVPFVFESIDGFDKKLLSSLTSQIADRINGIGIIYSDARLIIAVSQEINYSAGGIAKDITASFNLKGGGNTAMAQIGGIDPKLVEEIKAFIIKIISSAK